MGPETEQIADRIRTFIRQISPEYPVLTAWLFGSWAAGTVIVHEMKTKGIRVA